MKLSVTLTAVMIATLIAIEGFSLFNEHRHAGELRTILSQTYVTSLALEREIGYGGLIHNFKNYVLRPDEPDYYKGARKNAAKTLTLIDQLEADTNRIGIDVSLNETRKMAAAYNERIDVISTMRATRDVAPMEIDRQVRFNDEFALQEVNAVAQSVLETVNAKLAALERGRSIQRYAILGLGACGIFYLSFTLHQISLQARRIGRSNQELTEINNRLSQSNLALQQFSGIASHDLKTPIRHIALLSDMMIGDNVKAQTIQDYATEIRGAADRMSVLVTSLLDFARTGFRAPLRAQINASEVIAETISELTDEMEQTGADIQTCDAPVINADRELLKRVFHNLLSNSLKYARDDIPPKIVIECEQEKRRTRFSVADNGIGVDPKHAEKIFEPMERLHNRNSKYPGIGIGLSLVKSIVESHGGMVWLDKKYHDGAKISFTIPHDVQD